LSESMSQQNSTMYRMHALNDASAAWDSLRQGEKMKNSTYLHKFKSVAQAYEQAGGFLGDARTKRFPTPDEREEYLAVRFLVRSDPKRYHGLVAHVMNQYTCGQNIYPTTLSKAYDMLVNYKPLVAPSTRRNNNGRRGDQNSGSGDSDSISS